MLNGDLYIERRKHKRADMKFKINYKLIMGEEEAKEIKNTTIKILGESSDISVGGIKAEGPMPGNPGDIIRLEVLVDGRPEHITTFAEIKWIKGKEEIKTFGLEFLILKDADKNAIEELLGN
jgi:c-di-GMP-binding flagellar brake protein YcgR